MDQIDRKVEPASVEAGKMTMNTMNPQEYPQDAGIAVKVDHYITIEKETFQIKRKQ